MIVLIDNYDSFTYNLAQYLGELGCELRVFRNDEVTVDYIASINPRALVISPGPGRPDSAGITLEAIRFFSGKIPILGVCLGHQAIAQAFGGRIVHATRIMHGKTSMISTDGKTIFQGFNRPFPAMRYHSLVVDRSNIPDCLEISAESDDGEIMAIRHREHLTEGIQFHPESVGTPVGKRILRNFLTVHGINEK
ncbi:anthranilate synthase component II [Thermodesulforhabdus norvegica]|uniref:Anthranilate synthase, component II n=1 Tax=Thermodesulforhabdus norvegica TaxID=39841 RepID=A0A1I4U6G3_9BACT|nr:aminodeoxychorismate/anthranilate synthase component II [Thermodesulforhabdus norvegica]SFM84578.1 anthranilate synthase, component II [Thermodesulforhabdus norvegica]